MTEGKTGPRYTVTVDRRGDTYYCSVRELGLIVHGNDLAAAYEELEQEKEAVLKRHAEAGVRPPPGRGGAGLPGFLAAAALIAAGIVMGVFLTNSFGKREPGEESSVKHLLNVFAAELKTYLLPIGESVRATEELTRRMVNPNVWTRQSGGNGHYYKVVVPKNLVTWKEAAESAERMGGYLATMENLAENDFVYTLFEGKKEAWTRHGPYELGPWIGGYYDGRWKWVGGAPMDKFANWVEGHPVIKDESMIYGVNFFKGGGWISNEGEYRLSSFILEMEID